MASRRFTCSTSFPGIAAAGVPTSGSTTSLTRRGRAAAVALAALSGVRGGRSTHICVRDRRRSQPIIGVVQYRASVSGQSLGLGPFLFVQANEYNEIDGFTIHYRFLSSHPFGDPRYGTA